MWTRGPWHWHYRIGRTPCLAAWLILISSGCFHSARSRPGFPPGDRFVIPLIDPDDARGLYVATAINGHGPFLLQVDTGAWQSTLSAEIADALGIKPHRPLWGSSTLIITDAGGVSKRYVSARIDRLSLGSSLILRDVGVGLFPDATQPPEAKAGMRVAGILGMNVLRDLVLTVDFDRGLLILLRR